MVIYSCLFTCTNPFAANKGSNMVASLVPVSSCSRLPPSHQAVLVSPDIVWLSSVPQCEFPGTAVCPLPGALLGNVVPSKPNMAEACSLHLLHHILVGGIGGDGGQVSSLLLAEVLSIGPVLLGAPGDVPGVAVVAILLPALFARFNTLVFAAV